MKQFAQFGLIAGAALLMAACAGPRLPYKQQDYYKHAQTVPPVVVPRGIAVKPELGFYPVPPMAVSPEHKPPSLIPPGSRVEYYAKHPKAKAKS